MQPKLIVHVAEVEIRRESGMGRVAFHWREEVERRGHEFVHIGPAAVGSMPHPSWFPFRAWQTYKALNRRADAFLVHEAASGTFTRRGVPLVVFSHGLERRSWQQWVSNPRLSQGAVTLQQRVTVPLLRLRQCDRGIRRGDFLLLTHTEDYRFAQEYYGRRPSDMCVFRNGIEPLPIDSTREPSAFTAVFSGSWIPRKGIGVLSCAAALLHERQIHVNWILAATQRDAGTIWQSWPRPLQPHTRVVPTYPSDCEGILLAEASVFVLPSLAEGQPLSLLQAMAAARCCITTDCCGQRDLIEHGRNGLLFPVGDAGQLASLIERCYHNVADRRQLGQAAQASVRDRLWPTVSGEVADRVLAACCGE